MQKDKMSFSIQGGKYKGKKLYIPSKSTTRSTKSIIRGSVFDTLGHEIADENFIEVFAGSGSMGIEALSRGAKAAYFIEKDKEAYKILQKNTAFIERQRVFVNFGDSFELYLPLVQTLQNNSKKAFIYFDPPFDIRKGMEGIYEKVARLIEQTPKEVVIKIIVEHMSGTNFPDYIGNYVKIKQKKFGKSSLTYFTLE